MDKKTAIIYVRVSTAGQADEELPIESQIDRCKAKADELGATVLQVFRDDGRSGRDDNRPAFQAAFRFCEFSPPTYLITWSTSRFCRNRVDAGLYKRRLDAAGVELVYISTPIDRQSDGGWMIEGVMEIFDEWYSRQVAADTMRSMIKNARDGFWNGGSPPYGFRPVPAPESPRRRRLEAVPAEADTVRAIFAARLAGQGSLHIARALNAGGNLNRGRPWNKTSVGAVLRSEAVIGRTVFGRRDKTGGRQRPREQWIIVDTHAPIIDLGTWDTVQDIISQDSPRPDTGSPHSTWAFTGLLRCGACGASMQIESGKGRGRRYHYYNCRQHQRAGGCASRRISADQLDRHLTQAIAAELFTPESLAVVVAELAARCSDWARDNARRRQVAVTQITGIQHKLAKIYELFELHGRDTPNLGDLTQRLRDHKATIAALEQRITALDAEQPPALSDAAQDAANLAETLREIVLTTENKKKLRGFFGSFIDAIWIDNTAARIEYKPEALLNRPDLRAVPSTTKWLPSADSNHGPGD